MKTVEFKLTDKANTYVCMDCGLLDMTGTYVLSSEANERIKVLEDALKSLFPHVSETSPIGQIINKALEAK
jgi:hypothetical protein